MLIQIYYKQKKYDQALNIYNKIISKNQNNIYMLILIMIQKQDYFQVRNYIEELEKLLDEKNKKYNFSIYLSIINKIEDICVEYSYSDDYMLLEKVDEELIKLQNDFIINISNENYDEAKSLLNKIKEIIYNFNLNINTTSIEQLFDNLILKDKKDKLNKISDIDYDNVDSNIEIIKLASENKYKLSEILILLNYLIEKEFFDDAKIILNNLKKYENYTYNEQIKFLENKLKELEKISSLDEDINYTKIMTNGKNLYLKNDFKNALNFYEAGLYIYEFNLFNYYIGKIYYKEAVLNEHSYNYKKVLLNIALKYFQKYIKNGSIKYQKSVLYITKIKEKLKSGSSNKLLSKAEKFIEFENGKFILNALYTTKEKVDYYDTKPKKLIKKIKMTEDDFKR